MSRSADDHTRLFERLASDNRARLIGIARAYDRAHAEDLLQEILLQIWRALPKLREPDHAGTWCYRIALNTAISWRRSRKRDQSVTVDEAFWKNSVAAGTAETDNTRQIAQLLEALNEVDRALLLMLLDDLEYAAIAQILGLSEGAVRVRIHRLKKRVSTWEPTEP